MAYQLGTCSIQEKKILLNAIKERGFGIVYQPEELMKLLPGRNKNEILFIIEHYKKKGKEWAKNHYEQDGEEGTATEKWLALIHHHLPALDKKDDLSLIFVELLEQYAQEHRLSHKAKKSSVNYSEIYLYLSEVIDGKFPRDLNPLESLIVLSLLETLSNYIETFDTESETNFIQEIKLSGDENFAKTETDQVETSPNLVQRYIERCLGYPKIRKIRQCLNPLNVPVKLLQEEHRNLCQLLDNTLDGP